MLTDETKPIAEHALAYLQRGWHLVMMAHGTKGPTTKEWNSPAELVDEPGKAIARLQNGPQNMGLVHNVSGTCAIDVDDEAFTRHIWEEFGLDYDAIMAAGCRIWSKQNRDKVIFRAPRDLPLIKISWIKQQPKNPNDRQSIFELRAGPNQDVLPPSRHPDGHHYEWRKGTAPWEFEGEIPEIPAELIAFWRQLADKSTGMRDAVEDLCPWKKARVSRVPVQRPRNVSAEHQDVIGAFNRANEVGDILSAHGYKKRGKRYLAPSSSTVIPGVVVLDGKCFSHHGSDPLADGYAHDPFDLLVTLTHGGDVSAAVRDAANQLGIDRRPPAVPDMVIDLEAALAAQARRKQKSPRDDEPQISPPSCKPTLQPRVDITPETLLTPPGVVGDIVRWILETSQRPQPILAVAAALSMCSTVLGTKVATSTGLRTNLYFVGLGRTSAGKDHARKAVKVLLEAAGMGDNLGGEEFGSGQGLMARVARVPNTLFLPDEMGMLLQAVSNKKAASYEKAIIKSLLTLYGSTQTIVRGSEYANSKERPRQDIPYPCVSLYGVSTPETFYPALSSADVASGWLNRMLIVSAPDERPAWQEAGIGTPPTRIVDWIRGARAMQSGLMGLDPATPIVVPMAAMAATLFTQFRSTLEDLEDEMSADQGRATLAPLWGRAWEMAAKLALVVAVGKQPGDRLKDPNLEIDVQSAVWAIEFVKYFLTQMEREVASRVGDSELDQLCQEALRVVKAAGPQGRTMAELGRYSRAFRALDPRMQDTIVEMLKRREEVVSVQMKAASNGKARVAVVAAEHVKDLQQETRGDAAETCQVHQ
jgi:hypothetical protein